MTPISGKRMCRMLERSGWTLMRIKGSHHADRKAGMTATIVVPVHGNRDLKPGTQSGILKESRLTEDDLLAK